jgi:hypothetical protein
MIAHVYSPFEHTTVNHHFLTLVKVKPACTSAGEAHAAGVCCVCSDACLHTWGASQTSRGGTGIVSTCKVVISATASWGIFACPEYVPCTFIT